MNITVQGNLVVTADALALGEQINAVALEQATQTNLLRNIMSRISEFAAKQNEYNTRTSAAIDGIKGDQKTQADLIAKLLESETISDADKALLTQLDESAKAQTEKLEAVDALQPPSVPTGEGNVPNVG